jgi:nitrate/nitrite transport system ATP-binding protein
MKKMLLLSFALLATTFVFAQQDAKGKAQPSPAAKAEGKIGDKTIAISYHQPAVKGRKIWGDLVPFDKVWRTESRSQCNDRIIAALNMVHMTLAKDKRPSEISGGMKQRVGIARALAMEPKVLLLDEPFGALDALTRAHLQDQVMQIQQEQKNTVIMITHDVDEAVLLSDRIVMLTNGPAASIGEILDVKLPRPRRRLELVTNPVYIHAREAVLKFLYERNKFVEAA